MPTPFPGMNPYLERPGIWNQVHTSLIVDIQRFLTPVLRPHYHVAIEQRQYLTVLPPAEQATGIPDILVTSPPSEGLQEGASYAVAVAPTAPGALLAELLVPEEVKERYLEIRDVKSGLVITVIEILSPANKIGREGRDLYERKRFKILGSLTNLVEIDLLRIGQPFPMKVAAQGDYRILVSRSQSRPQADVYLFNVLDPIPDFPIPLRPGEQEPILSLNKILHTLYDQGGYDMIIDYEQPSQPPLSAENVTWLKSLSTG